jgi:hypothetical protein
MFLGSAIIRLARAVGVREFVGRRYLRTSRHIVQAGPFRNMIYVEAAHYSALLPKIAGSYESELHPYLRRIADAQPDVLIDVGAAEGYYAVGAAVAGWSPRIIAFETDASARELVKAMIRRNGLDDARIEVHGRCTPEDLASVLSSAERPVVIVDVEGFEALLIDPLRIPALARATLLVEYHDFILPGLSGVLVDRLQPTHTVEQIGLAPRKACQLTGAGPLLRKIPRMCRALLCEFRPQSEHGWLWFEPRANVHPREAAAISARRNP